MTSTAQLAEIGAIAGDPARAAMLLAMLDGRALTATELARHARIAPQTASGHLGRLVAAGLVIVEKQGRHRYHRLAASSIARMIESMLQVASVVSPRRAQTFTGPKDQALRNARTCYDHLAGQLGVALADAMVAQGHVELTTDAGIVTDLGLRFLRDLGIDMPPLIERSAKRSGRVLCRPCLDWSERRPHIAGLIGAAICTHSLERGWTRRLPDTRALDITPAGMRAFKHSFKARLP